jgi:IclR family pca regulon transcriptional regulator
MDHTQFPINKADLIEGLGKGLRLIEAFDDEHPRMTVSEAAQRTGLTRTAARRYLLSLCHFGYAATDGKQFWLAPRVLRLGNSFLEGSRMARLVQPFIQRITNATGETVNMSVLDGHEVVYIVRSSNQRRVSIGYQPGARVPTHVVTPGPVILSTFSDAALDTWLAEHDFAAYTPSTVTEAAVFRSHVVAARSLGYWVTEAQLDAGLRGVAVALKDRKGDCKGAIGTTLPMAPSTREQLIERFVPLLQECALSLRPLL